MKIKNIKQANSSSSSTAEVAVSSMFCICYVCCYDDEKWTKEWRLHSWNLLNSYLKYKEKKKSEKISMGVKNDVRIRVCKKSEVVKTERR